MQLAAAVTRLACRDSRRHVGNLFLIEWTFGTAPDKKGRHMVGPEESRLLRATRDAERLRRSDAGDPRLEGALTVEDLDPIVAGIGDGEIARQVGGSYTPCRLGLEMEIGVSTPTPVDSSSNGIATPLRPSIVIQTLCHHSDALSSNLHILRIPRATRAGHGPEPPLTRR
jgi:hypothetical protein